MLLNNMYFLAANESLNPIILIAIVAVFYFMILRPNMKKNKDQRNFITNLEKGKEVVTSGGIIGRINKIEDNKVTIETSSKTYIQVLDTMISAELSNALNPVEDKK